MSFSEDQGLKDESNGRQSYDDRFGDDLSEVILQYLPIKDKLRLELVSKQFQRTIFQRHYSYDIRGKVNYYRLELILKKCPNLRTVRYLSMESISREEGYRLMDVILEYCPNLTQVNTSLINYGKDRDIHTIFNPNTFTLYVDYFREFTDEDLTRLMTALSSVRELHIKGLYSKPLTQLMALKNLRRVHYNSAYHSINDFVDLVENNKRLKYIDIDVRHHSESKHRINHLLENISKLKDLVELNLKGIEINNKYFQSIALNCTQLKSISCHLEVLSKSELMEGLSHLKSIKQLKRLQITIDAIYNDEVFYTGEDVSPTDIWDGFQGLTHLSFDMNFMSLSDQMLRQIVHTFPNLISLKFGKFMSATELTADILSRLSSLEVIDIPVINSFKKQIETKLRQKCPKIRKIDL